MRVQLRQLGIRGSIDVLPIWVDTSELRPQAHRGYAAPVLLYSGNLGRKQGLDQVLALAERLAVSRPDIAIVLRGAGGEHAALAAAIAERGLVNRRLQALVQRDRLADGLAVRMSGGSRGGTGWVSPWGRRWSAI